MWRKGRERQVERNMEHKEIDGEREREMKT
jgi:hypothetical protein